MASAVAALKTNQIRDLVRDGLLEIHGHPGSCTLWHIITQSLLSNCRYRPRDCRQNAGNEHGCLRSSVRIPTS